MTVQAQNSVQYYNGPIEIGTELSIVEFTFIDNSHVSAKVRGNTEVWQYGYDYTVSGAQTLIRTITVQRRVAENEVLAVYLDVPITQNISPEEGGNFPASTNEYVLDKLTHISQMLDERVKRSLQISIDTPFSGTLPAPEPNKALKISSDGNSFVMSDYDPDLALITTEEFKNQAQQAAAGALASQNAATQQANIATQQANIATQQAGIATEKTTEVVESGATAIQNIDTAFNAANEWFSKLNAIPYIPVGTILPTTGAIDESLGYQRYANGQLIANVSSQAPDLVKFLEFQEVHAPNLLCSEAEWQTTLTLSTLGQVGKYVWNKEEDSIRIPQIVNIQGMIDMNTVGNMIEAGLPNITGEWGSSIVRPSSIDIQTGVFSNPTTRQTTQYNSSTVNTFTSNNWGLSFDASAGNSIYGNSNTVQEESILYPYVLQIATGVQYKTPVINEIELNNPFSLLDYKYSEYELNNLSWLRSDGQYNSKITYPAVYDLLLKIYNGVETKAGVSVKLSTDISATEYDFRINTANETFMLPTKVKLASGKAVVGNGITLGFTDGTLNYGMQIANVTMSTLRGLLSTGNYGKTTGTSFDAETASNVTKTVGITTDPAKSGIETSNSGLYLYFYVGETVQNANLINAGRIEEKISSLIPDNSSLISGYAMSSNRYINLTLGASHTAYTAPANGWFALAKECSNGQFIYMGVSNGISTQVWGAGAGYVQSYLPVLKGNVVNVNYTASGATAFFRFYYAEGDK